LSELLLTQPQNDPPSGGRRFVVADSRWPMLAAALEARVRSWSSVSPRTPPDRTLREQMWSDGRVASTVRRARRPRREVQGLFRFQRAAAQCRRTALCDVRGEKEEILELQIEPDAQAGCMAARSVPSLRP